MWGGIEGREEWFIHPRLDVEYGFGYLKKSELAKQDAWTVFLGSKSWVVALIQPPVPKIIYT